MIVFSFNVIWEILSRLIETNLFYRFFSLTDLFNMSSNGHVGILGSGLIGRSWAMIFSSAGYKVIIYDIVAEQVTSALEDIKKQLSIRANDGTIRGKLSVEQQINLIEGTHTLEKVVQNAFFLQECVPERLDFKHGLYKNVDAIINNQTILSSSTSTFMPSVLSKDLTCKTQFIVSHPVNPPYYVPLVEIVPAPWTDLKVVDSTFNLMKDIGQSPVKLHREVPGFALNRIQYAIINESFNLVEDGIVDVEDIDKVMTDGLGMRYAFLGPLETAHLNAEGFKNYCSRYSDSMYDVCKTFKPIPKITGSTADNIADQLEKITPIEKLPEKRIWRDLSLMKLSQLKKNN